MRLTPLGRDAVAAAVIAVLVLILAPGLAVVALIVAGALALCAISLVRDRLRARAAPRRRS
ncbi:MAG TPA: hypothetical protein VIL82_03105 [Solirubrobacteraceae bacterium]|jgi:hypothetical protein